MSGYKMALNKKYIVSTVGGTYLNELVEVIGIINYEEAKKSEFDVHVLALDEKVLGEDYHEYFDDIEFYKCKSINTNKTILLWSEIIDDGSTSVIGETYKYKATLKLNEPGIEEINPISAENIISALATKANEYGATLTFKLESGDSNTEITVLQQRLNECESILRSLQSLSTLTPVLDQLNSNDIIGKIEDIKNEIETISERLTTIAQGLS